MKWMSGLVIGLFLVGMAGVSYAQSVGTDTLRNKPAGFTREQAAYLALRDVMNGNGTDRVQSVTPDDSEGSGNQILTNVRSVTVGAVTNDAADFVVLPNLAAVPIGHCVRLVSNAGGAYEIRTPANSNQNINTVDSDGSQEYLAVDAEIHVFTKVTNTDGWSAYDIQAAGGIGGATTPD